jgi:hypothetical protein
MRSRSKGNNDMHAMGCFRTDHAQPRSKSPKARAVQHSEQQQGAVCTNSTVHASIRWRSGWSRGSSRSTNEPRVKGGDGDGQLGSVKGPFLGQVYFYTACRWGQLCRSTPIRSPGSLGRTQKHPEQTQNRPRTPRQPHPWDHLWGRRGPRHSETKRPGDQETQPLAAYSIGLPLFFSPPPVLRHVVFSCSLQRREKTSVRSRHSTMTSFRNPCNTIRHCSQVTSSPIHPIPVVCRVACAVESGTAV